MDRVIFLPRAIAAQWRPKPGSVLVSIHDRSEEPLKPQPGWTDTLWLRFHDTDGQLMGLEVFDTDHAQRLLTFVKQHVDAPELVVHCQMGQSRSAAVALYFAEREGVPCFKEQTPVSFANWNQYNRKVYAVLSRTEHGPVGSAFQ